MVPELRPFRALRFSAAFSDLSPVLAPPYDIISPEQRQQLLARDAHNIVRVELPADLGEAGPEDYARAAATAAAWREQGVLVLDDEPTVTVHQMTWIDGEGHERSATGLLCRLALEEYGPGASVLPHERTHGGPKADRYALLEATRLNTSPIVLLSGSDPVATSAALLRLTEREPDATATTADGVRHRLWVVEAEAAAPVLAIMGSSPLTIADGHHRYETALRHRRDHRAGHAAGPDPAWDDALALVYPLGGSPPALPTHRLVTGEPSGAELLARLGGYAAIERMTDGEELLARMAEPAVFGEGATGTGRIGLYTQRLAAILSVDRAAVGQLLDGGLSAASRGLDVNALGALLDQTYGSGVTELAAEGRLWYSKDAAEAVRAVDEGAASAAYLLDEMPPAAISLVAGAGEVMPQKSTYFEPKAPTGLVLRPLE